MHQSYYFLGEKDRRLVLVVMVWYLAVLAIARGYCSITPRQAGDNECGQARKEKGNGFCSRPQSLSLDGLFTTV